MVSVPHASGFQKKRWKKKEQCYTRSKLETLGQVTGDSAGAKIWNVTHAYSTRVKIKHQSSYVFSYPVYGWQSEKKV